MFFVCKQIITRLVVLHTFYFSPPRGGGENSRNYFTLTRACAPDSRHSFHMISYFMPAPTLYSRTRGDDLWITDKVEREIKVRQHSAISEMQDLEKQQFRKLPGSLYTNRAFPVSDQILILSVCSDGICRCTQHLFR